jgi:hypothetical protein
MSVSAAIADPLCYDEPSVGGLVPQALTVLHEYAPGSRRGSTISRRTVMNNAG